MIGGDGQDHGANVMTRTTAGRSAPSETSNLLRDSVVAAITGGRRNLLGRFAVLARRLQHELDRRLNRRLLPS